jgi:nucleoside permease NupC
MTIIFPNQCHEMLKCFADVCKKMKECIIRPENGVPETLGKNVQPHYEKPDNFFPAIIEGSQEGLKVVLGISALLIGVLGQTALLDMLPGVLSPEYFLQWRDTAGPVGGPAAMTFFSTGIS